MTEHRKLTIGVTLLVAILFCSASLIQAAVPDRINWQGKLTDDVGTLMNGTFTMQFNLYDVVTGGSSLWNEDQSVEVTDGIYNVQLGAVNPLSANLFSGDEMYLEVAIYNDGTTSWETLSPRQRLTSTAYAFQTENAQFLEGHASADFASEVHQHSGTDITSGTVAATRIDPVIARDSEITWSNLAGIPGDIADGDDVGISVEADPTVVASVKDGVSWDELSDIPPDFGDGIDNDSGGDITGVTAGTGLTGGGTSGTVDLNVAFGGSGTASTVSRTDHNHWGADWSGSGTGLVLNSNNGDGLIVSANSTAIAVTSAGLYGLYVGTSDYYGVYVHTADDYGIWVNSAGFDGLHVGSVGDDGVYVSSAGDDGVYVNSAGDDGVYVHIAGTPSTTNNSTFKNGFEVAGAEAHGLRVGRADLDGVYVSSAGDDGVYVHSAGTPSTTNDSTLKNGFEVAGAEAHGLRVGRADLDGVYVSSAGDNGLSVNSAGSDGVHVSSAGKDGVDVYSAGDDGVHVRRAGSPSTHYVSTHNNGFEVAGAEDNGLHVGRADLSGVMVNSAGYKGVLVSRAGSPSAHHINTLNNGFEVGGAEGDGLRVGYADRHGVYVNWVGNDGVHVHTADGYAGYFNGDVVVTGNLSKGSGSFKIDHPLDPENKYLSHSFVESPDMMNVYNGNVVLDNQGEAWVDLPEYFKSLNKDFRYQLTPIGAPMPNLYIAQEIEGNSFKIAEGEPGMKVSWQVTGIRQDPYVETNRIIVEEVKPEEEQGTYLHPEAYGLPKTMGVSYRESQEYLAMQKGKDEGNQ